MAKADSFRYSAKDQESLEHLANLLHLFHHRNKNQHRRSVWWRHFSVFRRQLNALVEEARTINKVPTTHLERTRKKVKDKETQDRISLRLSFWQDTLLPKWQTSFSQVVADGRFASLGLVLLAALAEICHITGITASIEELGQAEVEKVLDEFSKEAWEDDSGHVGLSQLEDEDVGEVVSRSEPSIKGSGEVSASDDSKRRKITNSETQKSRIITVTPSRKKRRKGDAIDDIFG